MYQHLNKQNFNKREQKIRFSPPLKVKNVKTADIEESRAHTTAKKEIEVIKYDKPNQNHLQPFANIQESGKSEMNQTSQTFNVDIDKQKVIEREKEENRIKLL